jgi:hypothetical protein
MSEAIDAALRQARSAGMGAAELAGWERLFAPRTFDECGCVSAILASALGLFLGALLLPPLGHSLLWLLVILPVCGLLGLFFGQRRALRQRALALARLRGRLRAFARFA